MGPCSTTYLQHLPPLWWPPDEKPCQIFDVNSHGHAYFDQRGLWTPGCDFDAENWCSPAVHVASYDPPLVARPQGPEKVLVSQTQKVARPPAISHGNFSKVPEEEIFDLARPMEKPMSIGPPETLREARLSPWWPQYKAAMVVEIDGHVENQTWIVVPADKCRAEQI